MWSPTGLGSWTYLFSFYLLLVDIMPVKCLVQEKHIKTEPHHSSHVAIKNKRTSNFLQLIKCVFIVPDHISNSVAVHLKQLKTDHQQATQHLSITLNMSVSTSSQKTFTLNFS